MLQTADATRIVGYLKPDTTAAILAAGLPDDAARILGWMRDTRACGQAIAR